ncbi:MAG: hypothetical protein ACI9VN_002744 [Patescibacteria group bacterium]|jgi:hypothetical protein
MRQIIRFVYLPILLISLLLSIGSCKKEEPPDRDRFLGTFSVVETCGSGDDAYNITIVESSLDEESIFIINFYDWGGQLNATVSGNDITIPSQFNADLTFSGSGTISEDILNINFTIFYVNISDNCQAICTR